LVKKGNVLGSNPKKKSDKDLEAEMSERLEGAKRSLDVVSEQQRVVTSKITALRDLHNHATGFYEEIDKLAKGKAMLEVTDRALEEINSIIGDTKRLVSSDPYLNRTSEFVAAGNNPVYPDVLLALRSVLQSLDRCQSRKREQQVALLGVQNEIKTIVAALEIWSEGQDEVSKADLVRALDGEPSPNWILSFGYNDYRFDFAKLKRSGLPIVQPQMKTQLALGSGE
jgi:hypothetical protein